MIFWDKLWLFIEEKPNFEFFLKILTLSDLKQLMLWFQRYSSLNMENFVTSLSIYKKYRKLHAFFRTLWATRQKIPQRMIFYFLCLYEFLRKTIPLCVWFLQLIDYLTSKMFTVSASSPQCRYFLLNTI
jgi:hypothetical protein